ncbi:AT-rich interactive domain-containing protein 2, partial [Plakobranchus ocellatus]
MLLFFFNFQLAVFIHNLSFEEANQKILARNYLVYKFLMLSLHSTYDGLRQIALDTIANLSCEIVVESLAEVNSKLMMDTLNDALFSDDRFFLVRGMEMMGKLSQVARNEEVLLDQLREDVYRRLVDLLTVQDIQLIVHTLEALYRLSKIGEPFTTRIARVHKAISVLVSLITIEAQSFGPGSLVGIKVVEYIPPAHVGPDGEVDPARKPTTVIQPINPDSI